MRHRLFRLLIAAGFGLVAGHSTLAQAEAPTAALRVVCTDQKGAAVADVAVSLQPLDTPVPPVHPGGAELAPQMIVQQQGEFSPYVTVVRAGTRILFPNRDQVQHHVYSVSPAKRFELPLHGGETTLGESFDQAGIVAVGCNIHDWMLAYVVVVDTPWFACSAGDGAATLTAPSGRYRLDVWHPRLPAPLSQEITLSAAASPSQSQPQPFPLVLKLRPDRRVRRALEGSGTTYD